MRSRGKSESLRLKGMSKSKGLLMSKGCLRDIDIDV